MDNKEYEKKLANIMGVEPDKKKTNFSKKNFILQKFDNSDPGYGKYVGYQSSDANNRYPYFDKDTINRISNDMINKHGYPMKLSYDDKTDTFIHSEPGGYKGDNAFKYKGEDVDTPEGKKRLYQFAPDWSWKESEDEEENGWVFGNEYNEEEYDEMYDEDEEADKVAKEKEIKEIERAMKLYGIKK